MKKNRNILLTFLQYLKPYTGRLMIILGLITLASAGTLASPYILKVIIDDIFPSKDFQGLINILIVLVSINIMRIGVQILSDYLHDWVSGRIIMDIRSDLFSHILRLPTQFFGETKKGDIIQRLGHEVDMIEQAMTGSAIRFVYNVLTILGLGVALSWLNFELFLISITVMPFIYFNIRYFEPRIRNAAEKLRSKEGDFTAFMLERLENIELLKGLNKQPEEVEELKDKSRSIIKSSLKETILGSANGGVTTFLISLTPIIIFGWSGKSVMNDTMTVGALIAFLQYLNRLFGPFRDLMRLYLELIQTKASMKRVFEYLELATDENEVIREDKASFDYEITFRDISFSHNDKPLINHLNLTLKKGNKYALVGKSGSGKSSLIKMLCHFNKPVTGQILLDNKDLASWEIPAARALFGHLGQNHQFYNDSILNNLRYGNKEANLSAIYKVTKITGVYPDIIKLPAGFETNMGDQGLKLSGGQKQLIATSRLLLTDKEVLIFDEATSALDSHKDELLWNQLLETYSQKTIIAISHRLSTIKKFDTIICLHEGKIVETGTHDQLISNQSYYFELVKDQLVFA